MRQTAERIDLAYREYGNRKLDKPSVVILHGTPIASSAVRDLSTLLAPHYHVISPDLPGFAGSLQVLPDYSSITHGYYMQDLIEALDLDAVHIVAYSQGGAPALTLASQEPKSVRSLTLIAAIGVQELELFGSYGLNHAVYSGQLAVIRGAQWLLPHFGYLDNAILGPGYGRNLTDTDQRLLRPMFPSIKQPVQIIHGKEDGLVPVAAAREHHRLLPQAELSLYSGGHEIAYATPASITPSMLAFLARVDAGTALTRNGASSARVTAANLPMSQIKRQPLTGIALVVLILAIIVASWLSEDLACIAAGLLVAQGVVGFGTAVMASLIGLFTGDLALFAAGRWLGQPALARWLGAGKLNRAQQWLSDKGPFVIIASRFMPGTRLPTYVAAGALRMPWLKFTGYFAVATVLWTPLLVGLAMVYGEAVNHWFGGYSRIAIWVLVAGVAFLWLFTKLAPSLLRYEGRRLLVSRWVRFSHFEYWPRLAFYPVIILYCLWLSLRYRSASLFSLANPGMPLGGLVGEPKSDILAALQPSGNVATFTVLSAPTNERRLESLHRFMNDQHLSYPIVLKPDLGQRGESVAILSSDAEAQAYFSATQGKLIAQAFAQGLEFGVFYIRLPSTANGFIYSITRKTKTTVNGNGKSTLRQLILDDDRAIGMAKFFLDLHQEILETVPANGTTFSLSEIGTHSRGSLFADASSLLTDALTAEIDRISKHFDGFYFGRYDLIVPDEQSLKDGKNIKIIELNGVSSEATHIYDPSLSVFNGWRVIARQWRYAYQIGSELREKGLKPASLKDLFAALKHHSY